MYEIYELRTVGVRSCRAAEDRYWMKELRSVDHLHSDVDLVVL